VPYTGVDLLSLYEAGEKDGLRWAMWDRNLMGFAVSPYNSIKMSLIVGKICRGDWHEEGVGIDGKELNPFQWGRIRLNLPGTRDYNPCLSWISKMCADGRVACDVFEFVNNERVTGPVEKLTWQVSHVLASKQSLLGVQDTGRKARPCSQKPGAWAGAIVHVIPDLGVCVLTSAEKWSKVKAILKKWSTVLSGHKEGGQLRLACKELLSDRGFLVYVMRTYPTMVPYLKEFHLTIKMWRGGQDAKGWKLPVKDDDSMASGRSLSSLDATRAGRYGIDLSLSASYLVEHVGDQDEAPANHQTNLKAGHDMMYAYAPVDGFTTPVRRFKDDIAALTRLTDFDLPPLRVVRPTHVAQVFYGFGDASGKQFGATLSENYNCCGRLSKTATGSSSI
jgi:hypothetical protein